MLTCFPQIDIKGSTHLIHKIICKFDRKRCWYNLRQPVRFASYSAHSVYFEHLLEDSIILDGLLKLDGKLGQATCISPQTHNYMFQTVTAANAQIIVTHWKNLGGKSINVNEQNRSASLEYRKCGWYNCRLPLSESISTVEHATLGFHFERRKKSASSADLYFEIIL